MGIYTFLRHLASVLLIILAWSLPTFCGEIHEAAKAGDTAKVKALQAIKFKLAASFAIPGGQTQLLNFVAEKDAVFASVRAGASALVRWDTQGKLIWKTEIIGAYKLARAGQVLALAYDSGESNAERGIYWIDPESGDILGQELLSGRPARMQYYPEANVLALIVYPKERMNAIEGSWMEVQGFKPGGKLLWRWKADVSELGSLKMDERCLAVIGTHPTGQDAEFVARLDPKTGKELWRVPMKCAAGKQPEVDPGAQSLAMDSCIGLPCGREGVIFLDAETGRPARWTPLPSLDPSGRLSGLMIHTNIPGTLYLLTDNIDGITAAAVDYASGKVLWQDETQTVSYFAPVAWGNRVVFMARRNSQGLNGRIALTELRIRTPGGANLACDVRETPEPHWNDIVPPQVMGNRLYVGEGRRLVAITPVE
jgi:outer membrane protein assembly factor BamB